MILLDTNAVLFLLTGHRRAAPLARFRGRLFFSPIVLIELQFVADSGRGRFLTHRPLEAVRQDPRWTVDDPGLDGVVAHASELGFTRDPFDRLIAGHALLRRFRLATSDALLLQHLPERSTLEL